MINKKEAISKLELMRRNSECNKDLNKVIDLTIKILRQTESEDCISRKQAIESLDRIGSLDTEADREYARDIFRNIPPVIPTERTGEWIRKYCFQEWKCSECEYEIDGKTNYCPNCGARMVGDKE